VSVQINGIFANLCTIIVLFLLHQVFGIYTLVVSVIAFFTVQLLLMIRRTRNLVKLDLDFHCIRKDVIKPLAGMIPLIGGMILTQLSTVIDSSFSSMLDAGSISAINYATSLLSFVVIFSYTPIQTVIYPEIVERVAKKDDVSGVLSKGVSMMLVLMIPITFGAILLKEEFITILYHRGNFDVSAVAKTASLFGIYTVSIIFNCLLNFYSNVFIANKEFTVTVVTGGVALIVKATLCVLLFKRIGVIGIALSTCVGYFANAITQISWLVRKHKCVDLKKLFECATKCIIASTVMFCIGWLLKLYVPWPNLYLTLFGIVILGFLVYTVILRLLKSEEYFLIKKLVLSEFRKIFLEKIKFLNI